MKRRPARTFQRSSTSLPSRNWKLLFARAIALLFFVSLAIFLWKFIRFRPIEVSCETYIHTYCQDQEEALVANLQKDSFWTLQQKQVELLQELQKISPSITALKIRRTIPGKVIVEITYAEELFPLQIQAQNYTVRQEGILTPTTDEGQPVIVLEGNTTWEQFLSVSSEKEKTLQGLRHLYKSFQNFRPLVRKIVLVSPTQIEAFPEGGGKILLHATSIEEVGKQMATLQAFFHSTTMEKRFTELDVRFEDVIVR